MINKIQINKLVKITKIRSSPKCVERYKLDKLDIESLLNFIKSNNALDYKFLNVVCLSKAFTTEMLKLLLEHKIDWTVANRYGDTPLNPLFKKDNLQISLLLMFHNQFPKKLLPSNTELGRVSEYLQKSGSEDKKAFWAHFQDELLGLKNLSPETRDSDLRQYLKQHCKNFSKNTQNQITTALCVFSVFAKKLKTNLPRAIIQNILTQVPSCDEWIAVSNKEKIEHSLTESILLYKN